MCHDVDMDIRAQTLTEADWQVCRDLRLEALRESPDNFAASLEEEARNDEKVWRERMRRARWLTAERDGRVGLVGLDNHSQEPEAAEVFGLWVAPQARRNRVAWGLVRAAAEQATADGHTRLYFWVGSENGPAVAFASAFGFRPTSLRRPAGGNEGSSVEEVAMVLSLGPDPTSAVNPHLP